MIPSPGSEVGTVGEALAQCPLQQREEAAMSAEINVITSGPRLRVNLRDDFVVDTDRSRLDLVRVHKWLSTDAFWAMGRSFEVVKRAADASINFGLYGPDGTQAGYARVVTDGVTSGWLCDVYLVPEIRGRGLGTALSRVIVDFIRPLGLRRFMLATKDAHERYAKTGFIPFPEPQNLMVLGSEKIQE